MLIIVDDADWGVTDEPVEGGSGSLSSSSTSRHNPSIHHSNDMVDNIDDVDEQPLPALRGSRDLLELDHIGNILSLLSPSFDSYTCVTLYAYVLCLDRWCECRG
jgi:hypothetical protein